MRMVARMALLIKLAGVTMTSAARMAFGYLQLGEQHQILTT